MFRVKFEISIQKECTIHRLENQCRLLPKYLRVSNCHGVSRVIRLGELDGNRFNIRLTNVRLLATMQDEEKFPFRCVINTAVETIKKTGFINYFGPQRFGRRVISTGDEKAGKGFVLDLEAPAIGLAMLRGDFMRAVKILLSPTEKVATNDVERAKRHFSSTFDVQGTLGMMPQHKIREVSVLRALHRYGTEDDFAYTKALLNLPHSSRLLYVHSFCSWVWNKIATIRLQKYGLKPVPGDLALLSNDSESNGSPKRKVRVVTEGDVNSGLLMIKDIVLSVPGNQVQYSPNMLEEYNNILVENAKLHDTQHSFRVPDLKLNAPGAYRRLIEFPRSLSHKFLPAFSVSPKNKSSDDGPVDLDQDFSNNSNCDVAIGELQGFGTSAVSQQSNSDVELSFDLAPSCYATVLLQELTKMNQFL